MTGPKEEDERVPEPQSSASEQTLSERPLPVVIPQNANDGLAGYDLPDILRSAGGGGLRGTGLLIAAKLFEQQQAEAHALRDDLRGERARNDDLVEQLTENRIQNGVLRERLNTRWVTYATGLLGAVVLGWAPSLAGQTGVFVGAVGALLILVTLIDLARRR